MIIKLFSLLILSILLNCSTMKCRTFGGETVAPTEILQFNCRKNPEFLTFFEGNENKIEAKENVTEVTISECKVNKFPTELFSRFQNVKGLALQFPHLDNLKQENFIGANQLENLSLRGGEFNISASIFLNAPQLRAFGIKYTEVGFFDPQAFNSASSLRTLVLNINMNETLPDGLFERLINLEVLDLYCYIEKPGSFFHKNEVDIETLTFPVDNRIKLLRLVAGNIVELKTEQFTNLRNLAILILGSNEIARIQPYTFVEMNDLILLDLRVNKIKELTRTMLDGLINLRAADFSHNKIRHIEMEAFSGTLQLRRLDLSHNKISILDPLLFNNLMKINHLDLSNNEEHEQLTVDLSQFCNLPNLSYLNLEEYGISKLKKCTQSADSRPIDSAAETQVKTNEIAELLSEWQYLKTELSLDERIGLDKVVDFAYIDGLNHQTEFSYLLDDPGNLSSAPGSRLAILNLKENTLSDWEDNLFDTFVNLRVLDLDENPIATLRSGQFNGLRNLLVLRLNECELIFLDFNVFSPLPNLRKLYLVGNHITTVTAPATPMNRLVYLELSNNDLESADFTTDTFKKSFNWEDLHMFH